MKIFRKSAVGSLIILLLLTGTAFSISYTWRDHAPPYDFLFGNHIDTHQQTKMSDKNHLNGFFYITFTGAETAEGVPIAKHGNCSTHPEPCTVGWLLNGLHISATLIEKEPEQHPLWCIEPGNMPAQPGYSHFHWLGAPEHAGDLVVGQTYEGYLLKLTANDTFFFDHHGGFLITPGFDEVSHANVITDCVMD